MWCEIYVNVLNKTIKWNGLAKGGHWKHLWLYAHTFFVSSLNVATNAECINICHGFQKTPSWPQSTRAITLITFLNYASVCLMWTCLCVRVFVWPTFAQVWVGFGLVTEALAASVSSSTDWASWRDVTAGSGHPRWGAGKSDGEREREEERGGHKQDKVCLWQRLKVYLRYSKYST